MPYKVEKTVTLDGSPHQGAEVDIVAVDGSQSLGRTTTDANGLFSVNVGEYSNEVFASVLVKDESNIPFGRGGRISNESFSASSRAIDINPLPDGSFMVALVFSRGEVATPSGWTRVYDATEVGYLSGRFTVFTYDAKQSGQTQVIFSYVTGSGRLDATVWAWEYQGSVPTIENIQEASSAANSLETTINYGNFQSVGSPVFAYFTEYRNTSGETTFIRDLTYTGYKSEHGWYIDPLTGSDVNGSRIGSIQPFGDVYYDTLEGFSTVIMSCDVGAPTEAKGACALAFTVTQGKQTVYLNPQVKRFTPEVII